MSVFAYLRGRGWWPPVRDRQYGGLVVDCGDAIRLLRLLLPRRRLITLMTRNAPLSPD